MDWDYQQPFYLPDTRKVEPSETRQHYLHSLWFHYAQCPALKKLLNLKDKVNFSNKQAKKQMRLIDDQDKGISKQRLMNNLDSYVQESREKNRIEGGRKMDFQ